MGRLLSTAFQISTFHQATSTIIVEPHTLKASHTKSLLLPIMFLGIAISVLGLATTVCHGLPNNLAGTDLESRDNTHHHFYAYTCSGCGCDPVFTVDDFGCGGVCRLLPQGIKSVGLKKDSKWDPAYPTGSLFAGFGCQGPEQHIGIHTLQTWGCTEVTIDNNHMALELYYNC